jgi:hypothetical protein
MLYSHGPQKYTPILVRKYTNFGTKMYHLATLVAMALLLNER